MMRLIRKSKQNRKSERGSALVYILIAIALLAALTVTFMEPSSQQTSSQSGFRTATEIKSQIDVVRSAVQECILRYSNGDQTIDNTGTGTDEDARKEYPINPGSTHLPVASRSGDRKVRNLRCPGNNSGAANAHKPLFGGETGKFMPAAPDLFEDWQWYNGTDGVFFWTYTTKSDAFLRSSLDKLDENFSECEADIMAAGADMDSDTPNIVACPAGATCFRVWMINKNSAPHGDGAPCGT